VLASSVIAAIVYYGLCSSRSMPIVLPVQLDLTVRFTLPTMDEAIRCFRATTG
jgi:hypothetical protein